MIRFLHKIAPLLLCFFLAKPYVSNGQFSIAAGSTNYTQDFNTLTSGTWTNGTTLSGWYAKTDATSSITSYGANTGSTTTAGLYAFGVAGTNALTDRALGFATSNSFTGTAGSGKNYLGWRLKNNTGNAISSVTVTWTGEQWRKEASPAQSLVLSYQTGATVTDPTAGTWTTTSSTFTAPQINAGSAAAIDGNATVNRTAAISVTITVAIAAGDEIMLRWEDVNDAGNDHMLAIDDVTVNAVASASCTQPTAQASFQSITGLLSNSMTVNFAAGTGGVGRMVVVKQGSAVSGTPVSGTPYSSGLSNDFSASTPTIATGEKVVYKGSGTSVNVTGLTPNTAYYVKVYEYNTSDCYLTTGTGNTGTATTTCDMPSGQATFGTVTPGTFNTTLNFAVGNGSGRLIKINTANTFTDPADGNTYTANSMYAGSGEQVVFNNTSGTSVNVTGLAANTTYYYAIYEYNCTGAAIIYNSTENTTSAATTATAPEINLKQGAANIATGGNYTYTAASVGATSDIVFTIENTGTATLNISSANVSGTGFTMQSAPPVSVAAGNTGTFTVRFTPSATGPFSGTATVNNDDADEGAYVINLSGTGTANSLSDITDNGNAGFYTANIDYTQWQSAIITSVGTGAGAGVNVFGMLLRDGGAAAADGDVVPTSLTALTVGYTGTAGTIRSAALFDGATKVADGVVSANSISFSGLSGVAAADDGSKALTLAVTFNTTVTDNDKLVFSITGATAGGTGVSSQFAAANAGGAASENNTGNDNNRIEVTANKIRFAQQPTSTSVNGTMSPAVTVEAIDANNNRDLDYTAAVSLTSTGTLTGAPVSVNAVNGLATFGSLVHTAAATGLTIDAASGSFTTVTSSTFNITTIVFVNGDYRTTGTGTWVSNNASPAIWEKFNGSSWATSNSPAYNTAANVYIQNGNTLTSGGAFSNSVNIKVLNGGTFNCNHTATTASIYIYDGGTMNIAGTLTNSGNFEVEDNGTVNINYASSGGALLWNGTEIFHPLSNVVISQWNASATTPEILTSSNISTNTYNGYTAAFGNLSIAFTADPGSNVVIVAGGVSANLAHNNLRIVQTNSSRIIGLSSTGAVTTGIGGNLTLENTFTGTFRGRTGTGTTTFNVKGNCTINGGIMLLSGSSGNGTVVNYNFDGNMTVSGTAGINYHSSIVNTPNTVTGNINLKGDLDVASGVLISSNNTGTGNISNFNFTGTGDGLTPATTQTCSIASTGANRNLKIDFSAANGAYVQLANQDLELGNNGSFSVANGGTIDFGFNGSTPLNIKTVSGATTTFSTVSGSVLKITAAAGITSSGATGNVQTGTRTFNTGATYHYAGNAGQVSGNGTPASVANLIVNNVSGATLSQATTVTGGLSLTSGILTTSSVNTLTVNAGATITGGNSGSFVNGPLTVKTNAITTISLPVGKGTAYGPAAIKPAGTTTSTYTAEYFNGANATPDHTNFGASSLVKIDSFQYWDISRTGGSADLNVTLAWDANSNVSGTSEVVVAHYTGTEWESKGQSSTTGNATAGTVTSMLVSSFSPFTVGSVTITPLAIKLSAFNAAKKQHTAVLSWSTVSELSSDHFELERSSNGKDYTVLTKMAANGHASEYSYTDAQPLTGNNYYRLAMVEANGKKQYSNVRIVNMSNDKSFAVTAYPNPVADKLTVQAVNGADGAVIQLMDMTGKLLQQVQVAGNVTDIDMGRYATGIYMLRYADGAHSELFKIVK